MNGIYGWHFTGNTLRDGRPIPKRGVWLRQSGRIVICKSGLHYSEHPYDALLHAPGPILHRVEVRGVVETLSDKGVARERRIISSMDATKMLQYFARQRALSVIHLWNAPDVVLDYLMTGAKHYQAAAWNDAWSMGVNHGLTRTERIAAWDVAMATARGSPWIAARAAASKGARNAFAKLVAECGPWE